MDEVQQLLEEAYDSVRQRTTKVNLPKVKKTSVEKTKGVKEPKKDKNCCKATDDTKNVRNILEGNEEQEDTIDMPESKFNTLHNEILLINEMDEEEEYEEAPEGGVYEEEEYEEAPEGGEFEEEEYEEAPEGDTVTVSIDLIDQLETILDQLRGSSEASMDELPEELPEELPMESTFTKISGVVGKKPYPLTGKDDRITSTTKAGEAKAKRGKAKIFAPKAKLKGADAVDGKHKTVKFSKKSGDSLFKATK